MEAIMIGSVGTSCFSNGAQGPQHANLSSDSGGGTGVAVSAGGQVTASAAHLNSLLCSLSAIKDYVQQVQCLVTNFVARNQSQHQPWDSASVVVASTMGTLIQEILATASSMMFSLPKTTLDTASKPGSDPINNKTVYLPDLATDRIRDAEAGRQVLLASESLNWSGDTFDNGNCASNLISSCNSDISRSNPRRAARPSVNAELIRDHDQYDIIELDAADLLAKYTLYCRVCGKGFKRDANLRMHMRAHGDEFKSTAALRNNPTRKDPNEATARRYSCPHEGCRWNRSHDKFQPLKSKICVKNHYKRSHCPKVYVCKRCNRKQFSVLSDMRTHEKHCGEIKWQCSCGTTFSRKDKLMGHVALFIGHTPMIRIP